MFVYGIPMHQDRSVMAQNHPVFARSLAATALSALLFLLFLAPPAQADPPFDVREQITDRASVLGNREDDVEAALKKFTRESGFQLFVVYVKSFDGMSGADWADETASTSGLGTTDILLAVATDDGRYGIAVPREHALSDEDFTTVETEDIRPALQKRDFPGAAIAAAEGYTKAAKSPSLFWGAIVVGGAVVAGAGAFAIHRTRRKYEETHVVLDEHGNPVDPLSLLSTEELNKRAGSALVAVDDSLKTSEQELGYAEAQFGKEATQEFSAVLADGRTKARKAFKIRQKLDDGVAEHEGQIRGLATEIIHLCTEIDDALDAQVEAFDALRDLQERAPEVLADTAERAAETKDRLPAARTALERLAGKYPAVNLDSITGNADQAQSLLAAATHQIDKGNEALKSGDKAMAVAAARAAEDGVSQAAVLLKAIDSADDDIQSAAAKISAGLTSLSADIADSERLAAGDAGIAAATDKARNAVSYAQAADNDPLEAVRDLQSAEATLDELLAPVRATAAEAEKARDALREYLERVTSQVQAVTAFIETRRGAVGAEARTRLSEAARLLDRAAKTFQTKPPEALSALQRAEGLARDAERLAQQDVKDWDKRSETVTSGAGGGANAMILGGILIESLLRGSGGGGLGGILTGGSHGSGSHGSPPKRGPGSFGGSSTRSRRGGGGRF